MWRWAATGRDCRIRRRCFRRRCWWITYECTNARTSLASARGCPRVQFHLGNIAIDSPPRVAVRLYSVSVVSKHWRNFTPGGEMHYRNRIANGRGVRAMSWAAGGALFFCFSAAQGTRAQSPNAAGSGAAKSNEGFYPGWGLGTRFEGSTSGDGSVFDLSFGGGYNFSHHFGVSLGIPYYFVGTPSAVKSRDPQAVSGSGLGNVGADLKWFFPGSTVNYASTIHLGAPTGDVKKGFSTGHATWNWANHIEHGWGNFTPFIDAGVGNTVQDTRYFHRPFMTFGYNAQFEAR